MLNGNFGKIYFQFDHDGNATELAYKDFFADGKIAVVAPMKNAKGKVGNKCPNHKKLACGGCQSRWRNNDAVVKAVKLTVMLTLWQLK